MTSCAWASPAPSASSSYRSAPFSPASWTHPPTGAARAANAVAGRVEADEGRSRSWHGRVPIKRVDRLLRVVRLLAKRSRTLASWW